MELNEFLDLLGEYKVIATIKKIGDNMPEVTVKIEKITKTDRKTDGTPYKTRDDGSPRYYHSLWGEDGKKYSTWKGGLFYGYNEGDRITLTYVNEGYGNTVISIEPETKDVNADMPDHSSTANHPPDEPEPELPAQPKIKTVTKDVSIKRQAVGKIASWCLQAAAEGGVKFKDMNEVMASFRAAAITIETEYIDRIDRVDEGIPF